MFKRIIIATDLSSAAFAVLKDLGKLKAFGVEEALLVESCSKVEEGEYAQSYVTEVLDKNLQEQRRILESQGIRVETRIAPGSAKKEICRFAAEEDCQLIVAGAEARTLVSEPLIGGTAYEIIHFCTKPILLVRLSQTKKEGISYYEPACPAYLENILFPTDFSQTAAKAFEVVKELAAAGAKKITLMHVQEQSRIDPYLLSQLRTFNEKDEGRLQEMKTAIEAVSGAEVEIVLIYGNPSRDILDRIEDAHVQLVVMGSQGRGYVRDLFLGSVSHNIARHSQASVLLIPAERE